MTVSDVLEPVASLDVPLQDISGAEVVMSRTGRQMLWLVSETDAVALVAEVGKDGIPGTWRRIPLSECDGGSAAMFHSMEAVTVDGLGRLVVLTENPPRVALVDPTDRWVAACASLVVTGKFPRTRRTWGVDSTVKGEGVLLLQDGHLLVAKERSPVVWGEWGPDSHFPMGLSRETLLGDDEGWAPPPDRLVLLHRWTLQPDPGGETLTDVSDMSVGPDGRIWVISEKDRRIGRLPPLMSPETETVHLDGLWALGGARTKHPEGLAIGRDGTIYVARDTKKPKGNLLIYRPVDTMEDCV